MAQFPKAEADIVALANAMGTGSYRTGDGSHTDRPAARPTTGISS